MILWLGEFGLLQFLDLFFIDLLLGGRGFEIVSFQLSPENKQGQKQELYKVIVFAGGLSRTSRDYPGSGF